jgi:hypothetical protein
MRRRIVAAGLCTCAALSACKNVPTDAEANDQGGAVSERGAQQRANPSDDEPAIEPEPELLEQDVLKPGPNVVLGSGEPSSSCSDVIAPSAPMSAQAASGEPQKSISLLGSDPGFACSLWLDGTQSPIVTDDLEVKYYRDGTAAPGSGFAVPYTSPETCSAVTVRLPSGELDAGALSVADAGAAGDSGAFDGSTDAGRDEAFANVDLALEGWHFDESLDGVLFQLCPNACATVRREGGLLVLDVVYAVRPAAAR